MNKNIDAFGVASTGMAENRTFSNMPHLPYLYYIDGISEQSFLEGLRNDIENFLIQNIIIDGVPLHRDGEEIGECAFEGVSISSISINIEKIGKFAFRRCCHLKEVTLGEKVKEIDTGAFSCCNKLEKITLNEGLKYIGLGAFEGVPIREITIPHTVEEIKEHAFQMCDKLEKVVIHPSSKIVVYSEEKLKEIFGENARIIIADPYELSNSTGKNEEIRAIEESGAEWRSKARAIFPSSATIIDVDENDIHECSDSDETGQNEEVRVIDRSSNEEPSTERMIRKGFQFNEEDFKQHRQTVSEDIANELGIKLINLVSREQLSDDDLNLVYGLLISGANPNMQDSFGNTGLMHMINKQLIEGAEMYLESGCKINMANNMGDTAFIISTRFNMVSLVKRLLGMGVYYQQKNMEDIDALGIARDNNYQDIVKLIEGVDRAVKPQSPNLVMDPNRKRLRLGPKN